MSERERKSSASGTRPRLPITLQIDQGGDFLSGVLVSAGVEQPFTGWLSLLSVLGEAIDAAGSGVVAGERSA